MPRVFIGDDHPIVREGLKHVLARAKDIEIVGETGDFPTLLREVSCNRADVAVLDVSMPGPGILEMIRQLKSAMSHLRIVVLSVYSEHLYARRVLRAGADGYLTATESADALAAAIRRVCAGKKYISTSLAEELATDTTLGSDDRPPHESLSDREYEVFLRLGVGESVSRIARDLTLSAKTVRTYRSRIIEKTRLRSTAEIIFYVLQRGLVRDVSLDNLQRGRAATNRARPKRGRLLMHRTKE
jgi:DNA-binding NarL/FixJ family response regulator